MIPQKVEDRLAQYYFHRYLPAHNQVELKTAQVGVSYSNIQKGKND